MFIYAYLNVNMLTVLLFAQRLAYLIAPPTFLLRNTRLSGRYYLAAKSSTLIYSRN
jgi:hypothetical protein